MKVEELKGAKLDVWVAKAEGYILDPYLSGYRMRSSDNKVFGFIVPKYGASLWSYSPSTDWSQGGPIIEREFIDSLYHHDGKVWQCSMFNRGNIRVFGKTQLIAAMRCYVYSKFGEETDDRQTDHI
jgi:hypothetical protein